MLSRALARSTPHSGERMAAKRWAHTGAVRVCEHSLSGFKVPRRGPPQKFYDILKPRFSDINVASPPLRCLAWLGAYAPSTWSTRPYSIMTRSACFVILGEKPRWVSQVVQPRCLFPLRRFPKWGSSGPGSPEVGSVGGGGPRSWCCIHAPVCAAPCNPISMQSRY